MTNPPEILETKRLRLRKPVLEDADKMFRQYAQDAEVTKYVSWRAHRNVAETSKYLRMCIASWGNGKAYHWVIERRKDSQLLGMISARVDSHKWELGYVLAPARVMENAGMKREGVLRRWSIHPNVGDAPRDSYCYSVIKDLERRPLSKGAGQSVKRKAHV